MIKIEFPADRLDIADALGRALVDLAAVGGSRRPAQFEPKKEQEPTTMLSGTPSVANVTDASGTAPTAEPNLPDPSMNDANAPKDANGVPFNAQYCANAKDPY